MELNRYGELIDVLRKGDENARFKAAYELREMREPRAIRLLADTLADPSTRVRLAAVMALAAIGSSESNAVIAHQLVENERSEVRARCAVMLGTAGDEQYVGALVQALYDKSSRVRASAARALGEIGVPAGLDMLRNLLNDDSMAVRFGACFTLFQFGVIDEYLLLVAEQLAADEPLSRRSEVDRVRSMGIETLDERDLFELIRRRLQK